MVQILLDPKFQLDRCTVTSTDKILGVILDSTFLFIYHIYI